jgi:transposase
MMKPPMPELSREEMWELILQLQEQLGAAQAKVAELEEKIAKPKKTDRNSSVPPSKNWHGKREHRAGKRRGGKPGHRGISRVNQEPDVVIECRAEMCTHCGSDLSECEQELVQRHQVIDIPPVKPVIIELRKYRARCGCGYCQEGRYPAGYDEPQQVFGPHLHVLISYFNGTHHIAHQRLQRVMADVFGLSMSAGAIVNSLRRTANKLERPAYDILRQVRRSTIIGSDETGMRVEGANWWLWTLQTPQASYFAIADTRAGDVLEALMAEAVAEIWCCDLFGAQLNAPARRFAICNAHQLRNLQFALDAGDHTFAPAMQLLLREGLHLARCHDSLSPQAYQRGVEALKAACLSLLDLPTEHPDARRLQRRFRKHHDKLWVFLDHPDVPFDNNASERALRPAVVHRKVIGGFRSEGGATAYALYRTIEDTARKQNHPVLHALHAALGPPLLPIVSLFQQ